jgi:MFS family permease
MKYLESHLMIESITLPAERKLPYTKDFPAMIRIIIWNCLGFSFLDFTLPFIAKEVINATGLELGFIYSLTTIGNLLSSPIAGWLTDRFARRKIVFIGSFGRGLAYFLLFAAIILKSYIGLAIGYLLLGFGVSFFWVPLYALIAEKTSKDHRSFGYGNMQLSQGKGILIGTTIGMTFFILGNFYTPGNAWVIYCTIPLFGIANAFAGFLFLYKVDENIKFISTESLQLELQASNEEDSLKPKKNESSDKLPFWGFLFLLIALFLNAVNATMAKPFIQFYLLSTVTIDPVLVIVIYLPANIVAMLISPYLGHLVDRINPYIGLTITAVLDAFGVYLLINTVNPVGFAFILLINFTMSISQSLIMQNFISRLTKSKRGRTFGLQSLFVQIGSIVGPIIGGILWDSWGIQWPFIISIYVEIALIPVILLAIRKILPHLAEK